MRHITVTSFFLKYSTNTYIETTKTNTCYLTATDLRSYAWMSTVLISVSHFQSVMADFPLIEKGIYGNVSLGYSRPGCSSQPLFSNKGVYPHQAGTLSKDEQEASSFLLF